ncbi:hypothetical protein pb186bvf_015038 [Paramecium bursaria]
MQQKILEYLNDCEIMLQSQQSQTVLELMSRSLIEMIYFLIDKLEEFQDESKSNQQQLELDLLQANENLESLKQQLLEKDQQIGCQLQLVENLENKIQIADQKLMHCYLQTDSQNMTLIQQYNDILRQNEDRYQAIKMEQVRINQQLMNQNQYQQEEINNLKHQIKLLEEHMTNQEEKNYNSILLGQKTQKKVVKKTSLAHIDSMINTVKSISCIQHTQNELKYQQQIMGTKQNLSMIRVEEYSSLDLDDQISTCDNVHKLSHQFQDPYLIHFKLLIQSVKLNLRQQEILDANVNYLWDQFIVNKIPFNKWYGQIKAEIKKIYD